MLLGLESYSYHLSFAYGKMDIFQFIKKTAELGLNGVQINAEGEDLAHLGSDDPDFLHEVKHTADRLGLFIEIDTCGTNRETLTRALNICKELGADILRVYSSIGGDVQEEMKQAIDDFKTIVPVCSDYGIRIAYENHEYESSQEIMRVVNAVNSQFVGTHIDVGNSMMIWEEPVSAVKTMASKAVSSHFKDHIVVMPDEHPLIIGVPLGKGNINLSECFRILARRSPLKRINIEVCYGYIAPFHIGETEGYGGKLGQGCFKIVEQPYNSEIVAPYIAQYLENPFQLNAFSWSELADLATSDTQRKRMVELQNKAVEDSVEYVKQLNRI
jgi:sugar phosphate isomerase/epimerase